ncbi:MAG: protein translocase subunit SecD [Candidatus Staskawiczbacteria bacterium CG10_big_fil_rev_8_21_14_0_10_38_10]|uniref:Protein translocase subunit SecD n=1 Tax=Candidatus Staskawiczbacteria bacterium CG10_big_fil_rev_8_21_14_0_10_38_10 TaxID=1974891 RepID=A0A2H9T162_9BACT|nr:MAG: protein translocase subunit SecD [Candidatus Staskawiczbacteria bacterium CG10_big_fil_rev_8_21_14_0_10_38_10]
MSKKRVYLIVVFIFILAFFAGNLVYPKLLNISQIPEVPFKLGLDLQGGTHLIYDADLTNLTTEDVSSQMQGLRDVIERRVNLFGVQEPVVQVQEAGGKQRLIVELAGVKDPAEAIKMIGETPYLEFKEQKGNYGEILNNNQAILESEEPDFSKIEEPFQTTSLTGKYLESAELGFDQTTYKPEIQLQFNSDGAKLFEEITARNIGKPIAIFLDGLSIIDTDGDEEITFNDLYAPIVKEKITGGKAVITGEMNIDKAKEIVRRLNSGALPVKIGTPISQKTVGPILGQISLEESLEAGMYGFLLIVLFMIIFYRIPGLLASLALIIYIALILSLFKLIPVTLTLAGIAGFLLSMGMAVDANILMFSRMKEELKIGKSYLLSIEDGLKRAWPSIRDGNLTTILVGLILFGFGTSFVKGFALTLVVGNLVGMFSAIVITNNFLKLFSKDKSQRWLWLWR